MIVLCVHGFAALLVVVAFNTSNLVVVNDCNEKPCIERVKCLEVVVMGQTLRFFIGVSLGENSPSARRADARNSRTSTTF